MKQFVQNSLGNIEKYVWNCWWTGMDVFSHIALYLSHMSTHCSIDGTLFNSDRQTTIFIRTFGNNNINPQTSRNVWLIFPPDCGQQPTRTWTDSVQLGLGPNASTLTGPETWLCQSSTLCSFCFFIQSFQESGNYIINYWNTFWTFNMSALKPCILLQYVALLYG